MSDAIEAVGKFIGRLYTNFILRDLTFFVSGGIVIVLVLNNPLKELKHYFVRNGDISWVVVLVFLAISYVLGVLLQEAARIPLEKASKWYNDKKFPDDDWEGELVVKVEELLRMKHRLDDLTLNGLERILFLKQIAATQFSAMGAVIVILKVRFFCDIGLMRHPMRFFYDGLVLWGKIAILILGMALCFWMYLDKARQQEEIILDLLDPEE